MAGSLRERRTRRRRRACEVRRRRSPDDLSPPPLDWRDDRSVRFADCEFFSPSVRLLRRRRNGRLRLFWSDLPSFLALEPELLRCVILFYIPSQQITVYVGNYPAVA